MATTIQSNASDSALLVNGTEALPFNLGGAPRTLESLTCTQASGALTFTVNPTIMQMRSSTLTSGVPQTIKLNTAVSLVLPSGGTLGFPTTVAGRIIVVLMANGEPAIVSLSGGNSLDETGLINTTAISASSTANNVFYSTTARTNQPYRVVGAVDVVNTAGAWGNPTLVQPYGGNALSAIGGFLSSANGYQKLPSGLIIQWGTTGSISAGGTLLVAIPVAFTTANLSAVCMARYSSAPNAGFMVSISTRTLTNMSFYNSNTGVALSATWFAIGY